MKVTTKEMKAILKGKELRGKDLKPITRKIANDMTTKIDLRFRDTKGPDGEKWAELSEVTKEKRRRGAKRGEPKPLNDTGNLKQSINAKFNNTYAVAGTNLKYARYQQEFVKKGASRSKSGRPIPWGDKPARPFIGFSKKQIEKYTDWVNKYINKP